MASEYLNNKNFERLIVGYQTHNKINKRLTLKLKDLEVTKKIKQDRNKEFSEELLLTIKKNILENNKELNKFKNELAKAFYLLSENLVNFKKFSLIEKTDAIQEAVCTCFERMDKFETTKGKAFNYMTTCIMNHFRHLYRCSKNYNALKTKYTKHLQETVDVSKKVKIKLERMLGDHNDSDF